MQETGMNIHEKRTVRQVGYLQEFQINPVHIAHPIHPHLITYCVLEMGHL